MDFVHDDLIPVIECNKADIDVSCHSSNVSTNLANEV